jgi:hypothetical protein
MWLLLRPYERREVEVVICSASNAMAATVPPQSDARDGIRAAGRRRASDDLRILSHDARRLLYV